MNDRLETISRADAELVAKLRTTVLYDAGGEARSMGEEAADALEAQAAEIARRTDDLRHIIAERDQTFALMLARAEKAEAERDAALARLEKLRHQITEASDPDFIWGAMDNVNDFDVSLDQFAEAASRAIRGAMQITGEAE